MINQLQATSASQNLSLGGHGVNGESPWAIAFVDEQDVIVIVIEYCFILAIFYTLGHLMNNAGTTRSVTLLIATALLSNTKAVISFIAATLPVSTYLYATITVSLQVGLALTCMAPKRGKLRANDGPDASFLKPLIFPCRTTHSRLFPEKHSFSYSYLLVGIPVRWEGTAGTLVSVGEVYGKHVWFTVSADDYLARGRHDQGLQGKLNEYLSTQGVPANQYAHAYLITAPRFLGFSFNPVSFWYLYGHDGRLAAMILEVNNTFDERRMYYMECEHEEPQSPVKTFRNSWPKDFHVSPFNDRDGSYSLTARDIRSELSESRLDNNIVLLSSDGKPKIVARVYSTEHSLSPRDMSGVAAWSFLWRWWWVGFMTNPRILREARLLWIKGLQVFYRPEVLRSSIGRTESFGEGQIEPHFRNYLRKLLENQKRPIRISYHPAAGPERGQIIDIESVRDEGADLFALTVDVQVLTPAFYHEILKFSSMNDAFSKLCFEPVEGAAMIHSSDHQHLREMVQQAEPKQVHAIPLSRRQSFVSKLRGKGIVGTFMDSLDIIRNGHWCKICLSGLDLSVRDLNPQTTYEAYLQTVTRMLLTDQLALGFTWVFSLYVQIARLATICLVYGAVALPLMREDSPSMLLRLVVASAVHHAVDKMLEV